MVLRFLLIQGQVIALEAVHLKRRLTAVLIADVVGYSRLMSADEEGTHVLLSRYANDLIGPKVAEHGGRLMRCRGDGFLGEFDSAVDAVRCGVEIQRELATRNSGVDTNHRVQMRIGVNTGDVIVDDRDVYGNIVNIAARLEDLAEPGEVYVTRGVRDQLLGQPDLSFEDRGERRVKNIEPPIRVFRVEHIQEQEKSSPWARLTSLVRRLPRRRWVPHSIAMTIGMLAAAAVLFVGGLSIWRDGFLSRDLKVVESEHATIMVLPFRNLSGNREEDYFADAVTDDLITDLSRLSGTSVIASATSFTYKGKAVDAKQVGRECNVRYLLEGSIRKIGTKVLTNAQLIDARSAVHIWADRFKHEAADLMELQAAVTGRIANSLGVQLVKAENTRALLKQRLDPNATDLRLRAMALIITSLTEDRSRLAQEYLEKAVAIDPLAAESWSELASLRVSDYLNFWNRGAKGQDARKELLGDAETALKKAYEIDPSIAMAHVADGFIRRAKGDHQGALEAYDLALQLNPNLALAYAQKANQLALLGKADEAPLLVGKAIQLSPRDPSIGVFYWILGRAYFVMGRYDDAIIWLRRSIDLRPTLWFSRAYLVSALALAKRDEAKQALQEFRDQTPGYDLARIRAIYDGDVPNDPGYTKTVEKLYEGLRLAGM